MTMKTGIRLTSSQDVKLVVTEISTRPHTDDDGYYDGSERFHAYAPAVYVTIDDDVQDAVGIQTVPISSPPHEWAQYTIRYAHEIAQILREIWRQFGHAFEPTAQPFIFNQHAGCECSCSPGFTMCDVALLNAKIDFWVKIELDN
jgi:hypothetical protein